MKKIVIVSKWVVGMTPVGLGFDKGLNPFKKGQSTLLANKLNEQFKNNNIQCEATVDNDAISIEAIVENGANLILISPYVKSAILPTLTEKEKEKCYFLTEDEFLNTQVDSIINVCKTI